MNLNEINTELNIFTKCPVPGLVKTRLIPDLSAEKACELYSLLFEQTFATSLKSRVDSIRICYAAGNGKEYFEPYKIEKKVSLYKQLGNDLGERMYHAISDSLQRNDCCVLIGCDCPTLMADDIHLSTRLLEQNDVVIGPATDGGYYLIACKQAHEWLFNDITWGGSNVLNETKQRLDESGLKWQCLREQNDIDVVEDLYNLQHIEWLQPFININAKYG